AGIPVTHRGLASGFLVLSGHAASAWRPVIVGLAPASVTLVVLMGVASRAELARDLLARGWAPSTPAADYRDASLPTAHRWVGTLAGLGDAELPEANAEGPGTLVIGAVVDLADVIAPASFSVPAPVAGRGI